MAALTPRPTRRTRARHGSEKESIEHRLLAAIERLLKRGQRFRSQTVEQLSSEAGISRGTFYLHFKDKGDLIARLMGVLTDEIVQAAGAWLAYAEKPQRQDIEAALFGVAEVFKRHRAIFSALNDTATTDPTVEALYIEMLETVCTRCRYSVSAARRAGTGRPDIGDDVADALTWIVVLYFGRFAPIRQGADFERLAKAVTHICAASLFPDDSISR